MSKPKILILIPCWKRPEITEICFRGLQRLRRSSLVDIDTLTIISEPDYRELTKRYNIRNTFFVNTPLGRKKNHGLQVAMKKKWDYLMEINSDDLIHTSLIEEVYLPHLEKGEDYLGIENFCFLNSETGQMKQYASKTVYGIGRIYSRKAVMEAAKVQPIKALETCMGDFTPQGYMVQGERADVKPEAATSLIRADFARKDGKIKYKLWNDKAERGMDNYSDIMMNRAGYTCKQILTEKPLAVDIKSKVNLWAFNPDAGEDYSLKEFMEGLSSTEKSMIINLLRRNNVEFA